MDIMKVKDEQGNWITVPAFQGQIGKTPSFSIGTVDLGTTPSSAAATITGTDEEPVLNLVLPKGINGDTGSVGIAVQDTEPNDTLAWIDTSSTGNLVSIPEIKDDTVNVTDTWSSAKIRDFIYPVGSIYLSVNNINPSTIFGGTWEQIQDTFLLAAGNTYTAGSTGGEATHLLTSAESGVPAHTHPKVFGGNDGSTALASAKASLTGSTSAAWGVWFGNGYNAVDNVYVQANTAVNANQAHNNMPPYLAVYMWKRLS